MKYFIAFILLSCCLLCSCGNDDSSSVIEEPEQPNKPHQEEIHPKKLLGVWSFYSGSKKALSPNSNVHEVLNHRIRFNENGFFCDSITYIVNNYNRKIVSEIILGTWKTKNDTLIICHADESIDDVVCTYSIDGRPCLHITHNNDTLVFYKKNTLIYLYPNLLIGSWNTKNDNIHPTEHTTYDRYTFTKQGNVTHQRYMYSISSNTYLCFQSSSMAYSLKNDSIMSKNGFFTKIKFLNVYALAYAYDDDTQTNYLAREGMYYEH